MKVREVRNAVIVCVGLGSALLMDMTGHGFEAGQICSATLLIWFFFL